MTAQESMEIIPVQLPDLRTETVLCIPFLPVFRECLACVEFVGSVVGRITVPRGYQVLTPGACECHLLWPKGFGKCD